MTSPGVPEIALGVVRCNKDVEHQQSHAVAEERSVEDTAAQIGCALFCYEGHP